MDATGWDDLHRDDLGAIKRDRPSLEAEVRRLRAALLRIDDGLSQGLMSRSWERLRIEADLAKRLAEETLAPRSR